MRPLRHYRLAALAATLVAVGSCASAPRPHVEWPPPVEAGPPQIARTPDPLALALPGLRIARVPDPAPPPEADPFGTFERAHAVLEARAPRLTADQRYRVATALADIEAHTGLDPLLVLSVIAQESAFDPRARGPRGAVGLMQIRPFVAEAIARREGIPFDGEISLLDPEVNVRIGTAYLVQMLGMYGDAPLALTAYNMGPYRLRRMLEQGRQPLHRYSGGVAAHYKALARIAR